MEWMFNNAEGTGNALINDISRVAHEALHGGGGSADISGVIETSGILLTPIHSAEGSSQSVITDLDPSTNPLMTKGMLWINKAQDADSAWNYLSGMLGTRASLGVAALGGKLYAAGGNAFSGVVNTAEVYDPIDNSWNPIAAMNTLRAYLGVAALGGRLYATGGASSGPSWTALQTAEVYDPIDNSWNSIASMTTGRYVHGGAALGGKLYAVGGRATGTGAFPVNTAEVYDPIDNSWNLIASMNTARMAHGVAALGGKLYAVGGLNSGTTFDTAEVYDPIDNSWNYIAPMNTARSYPGVAALGGKLYAVGGIDSGNNFLATVEVYDPADPSGGWNYISQTLNTARAYFGLATLGGRFYAVGGQFASGPPLSLVTAYDPSLVQMPQITHQGEDFYISHQRGGPKTFIIPHPEHEGKMLRHACLEAPTRGTNVYEYQITTTEENQTTEIALPSYFKHINDRGRVYVCAGKGDGWRGCCGGRINKTLNYIIVYTQKAGTFNIMVTGVRKDPQAIAYSATENIDSPIDFEDIPTK